MRNWEDDGSPPGGQQCRPAHGAGQAQSASIDQLRLNLAEIARQQDIWINPALVERLLGEIVEK